MADSGGAKDYGLIVTCIGTMVFGAVAVYAMTALLA